MTPGNFWCLLAGLLIGGATVVLVGIFLNNRTIRAARRAWQAQERDDAAFGPTDHPLDRTIDDWRKS